MRHRQDQDSRVLRLGKSVSSRPRGSLTVEAALCLPLFFLAALLLMLLLETAALSVKIRGAARYAAQATAAAQIENPVVLDRGKLQADLISALGAGRVDENILIGGRSGISVDKSEMDPVTGVGFVRWKYRVRMPFPVFGSPIGDYEGEVKFKAWNGFHSAGAAGEEEMVYVTENGIVYHRNPSCTHLALSVTPVSVRDLASCRNQDGKRYHVCEKCGGQIPETGVVYIAKDGDKWHADPDCSGLKRTVEKVPVSQAGGRGPCSRCSQ